jgi:polysaccharide biosynthesis/export protein
VTLHRLADALTVCLTAMLMGCAQLPGSGPSREQIERSVPSGPGGAIQVIDVDAAVTQQLLGKRRQPLFSEVLESRPAAGLTIGAGDTVEIVIWEAPPATLFGGSLGDVRQPATARGTTLPEQMVDRDGFVSVPFAGRVQLAGMTPEAAQQDIEERLRGKANQPQVLLRVTRNASAVVTVVGEVSNSTRIPLTASGERVLDALAAAGGVRQPVGKTTLQLTRGDRFHALPLDLLIRDPRQNVRLLPGDVITALVQPLSFTALGATGRNEEISFETQGLSLVQALARAGGLVDSRSSPQGVFLFRLEAPDALSWPRSPVARTPAGQVPVVYRFDLRDPASFFTMQSFQVADKDVLFVSNAPAAELQKFLNLVFSVAYPVLSTIQLTQ